jgi:hypothetical protein
MRISLVLSVFFIAESSLDGAPHPARHRLLAGRTASCCGGYSPALRI